MGKFERLRSLPNPNNGAETLGQLLGDVCYLGEVANFGSPLSPMLVPLLEKEPRRAELYNNVEFFLLILQYIGNPRSEQMPSDLRKSVRSLLNKYRKAIRHFLSGDTDSIDIESYTDLTPLYSDWMALVVPLHP